MLDTLPQRNGHEPRQGSQSVEEWHGGVDPRFRGSLHLPHRISKKALACEQQQGSKDWQRQHDHQVENHARDQLQGDPQLAVKAAVQEVAAVIAEVSHRTRLTTMAITKGFLDAGIRFRGRCLLVGIIAWLRWRGALGSEIGTDEGTEVTATRDG